MPAHRRVEGTVATLRWQNHRRRGQKEVETLKVSFDPVVS